MAPTNVPDAIPEIERATLRKVTWRILPFLMLAYFIAFVDRVNAGFAALQMNHDIGLSAAQFGLGGGLFYVSYPSTGAEEAKACRRARRKEASANLSGRRAARSAVRLDFPTSCRGMPGNQGRSRATALPER